VGRPPEEPEAEGGVSARLAWEVVWVDAAGRGLGRCRHEHADRELALACPFEPAGLPLVCAGLVREVRAADGRAPKPGPAARARQLELRGVA
jgi:hypothetical protein